MFKLLHYLIWAAGRDSPNMWISGDVYRFGHQYQMLKGASGLVISFGTCKDGAN